MWCGVCREKEAAAMRSMKNVDNRSQLQQQIDYRKYKEEMEKQEAYLADKQTQYMEKLHQQVSSYTPHHAPLCMYVFVEWSLCACVLETYGARWHGSRPPAAEEK